MCVCLRGEKGEKAGHLFSSIGEEKEGSCYSLYILLAFLAFLVFSTLEFCWSSAALAGLLLLVSTYTDTLPLLPFLFVLVD